MKFLLEQDVYATTARFLEQLGHDVVPVARVGLSRASDEELSSAFVTIEPDGHRIRRLRKP
jgi:predicted nuclease of predicted toxin-antitoxin system